MEDRVPPSMRRLSGEAARLGTAAHGLCEVCLKNGLRTSRGLKNGAIELDRHEDASVFWPSVELRMRPGWYLIDDDMCNAVDMYLDHVWGVFDATPSAEMFVERRFNLSWLRPDMFGTGDVSIFQLFGRLHVVDYKHGAGVPVDVVETVDGELRPNVQLMYYGLGLANDMDWLFEDVMLTIVQPRCDHADGPVRSVLVTKQQLRDFQDRLAAGYDAVQAAEADPEGALAAGSWCKWCDAASTCPARMKSIQEAAGMDFADDPLPLEPPALDTAEARARLARILLWAPEIDSFLRTAQALAERMAKQGERIEGHKLVRGKANRQFIDGIDVIETIAEADPDLDLDELLTAPKLKSPAQIEKLSKRAKALVQGVWDKTGGPDGRGCWVVEPIAQKGIGKVTLVPLSDKRAEVPPDQVSPADDFADDLGPEGDE